MNTQQNKISVNDQLPEINQIVDVWIKEHIHYGITVNEHQLYNQIFKKFGDGRLAFQDQECHRCGLYEWAYMVDENLVTHWTPSSQES